MAALRAGWTGIPEEVLLPLARPRGETYAAPTIYQAMGAKCHQDYFGAIVKYSYFSRMLIDVYPLDVRTQVDRLYRLHRIRAIKVKKAPLYKKAPPIRYKNFLGGGAFL